MSGKLSWTIDLGLSFGVSYEAALSATSARGVFGSLTSKAYLSHSTRDALNKHRLGALWRDLAMIVEYLISTSAWHQED